MDFHSWLSTQYIRVATNCNITHILFYITFPLWHLYVTYTGYVIIEELCSFQVLEECHDAENYDNRKEGNEMDAMQMGGIDDDDDKEETDIGLNV